MESNEIHSFLTEQYSSVNNLKSEAQREELILARIFFLWFFTFSASLWTFTFTSPSWFHFAQKSIQWSNFQYYEGKREWVGAAFPLPTVFTFCILRQTKWQTLSDLTEKKNKQTGIGKQLWDRFGGRQRQTNLKIIWHTIFSHCLLVTDQTRLQHSCFFC